MKKNTKNKKLLLWSWGHVSDKITPKTIHTPEGNAWWFLTAADVFMKNGWEVYSFYPREWEEVQQYGINAFKAFEARRRYKLYYKIKWIFDPVNKDYNNLPSEFDLIIWTWRWDRGDFYKKEYGIMDLQIQDLIINKYASSPKIIIDEASYCYEKDIVNIPNLLCVYVHGFKPFIPNNSKYIAGPFPYTLWKDSKILPSKKHKCKLKHIVYVGNRYERDEDFKEYFVPYSERHPYTVHVYGNWFRTLPEIYTQLKWWYICYHKRIGFQDFYNAYSDAYCCLNLFKKIYNECGLFVQRIFESLYFGTIPLLPSKFFGAEQLVGSLLTVYSVDYLEELITKYLMSLTYNEYEKIRQYLWSHFKEYNNADNFYKRIMDVY